MKDGFRVNLRWFYFLPIINLEPHFLYIYASWLLETNNYPNDKNQNDNKFTEETLTQGSA